MLLSAVRPCSPAVLLLLLPPLLPLLPPVAAWDPMERVQILEVHNSFRRLPVASNMLQLAWSLDLESSAQRHADACNYSHRQETSAGPFSNVRENIFLTSALSLNITEAVASWYGYHEEYSYLTNLCYRECKPYIQLVWAETMAVGCGLTLCEKLETLHRGLLVVCSYGPGAVGSGEKPYRYGPPCTECPQNSFCNKNFMCEMKSFPTTAATTTTQQTTTTLDITTLDMAMISGQAGKDACTLTPALALTLALLLRL